MLEKSHGVIIRVTRLTDTSSIVRWWTMEHGMIDTVAKGARRATSPFAGKIDLFFSAYITWARAKSGTLHHLRECAVSDYRQPLRHTYDHTLLAAYFCAWMEKITQPEHPDPHACDLLIRGLDHLTVSPPTLKAMRHFERELARLHGVDTPSSQPLTQLADLGGSLPAMRQELIVRLGRKG